MILVVGGTGDLGGRIVRLLREQGHEVRCLVRAQTDDSALRELGAEISRGDLTDAASLVTACEGVTTIVSTATVIARRLAGEKGPSMREVEEEGMASLIDTAESAGVQRFVYVSFPGFDAGIRTAIAQAKLSTEERLAASSMEAVIVRADGFQEIHFMPMSRFDMAAGKAEVIGKGDSKRRWISTDDVAALVAAVVVEADPPGLITVGGPEAISKNEVAALAGEITGRGMKVKHMPRPIARLMIRLLGKRNEALASVLGIGLNLDEQPAGWDDAPLRQRGIEPKSVADFLRAQAAGSA